MELFRQLDDKQTDLQSYSCIATENKLKSLKVAQVKDEMDDDEDDGCDGLLWCNVVLLCFDVMLYCVMMLCCYIVCDGMSGGECCGKVE